MIFHRSSAHPLRAVRALGCAVLMVLAACLSTHAEEAVVAKAAPRSVSDIVALLARYPVEPGRAERLRAALAEPEPRGGSRADLRAYHLRRLLAAKEAGAVDIRIESARKVVEIGGNLESRGYDMGQVLFAELEGGSSAAALERIKSILWFGAGLLGQNVNVRVLQAIAYISLGDTEAAARSIQEAERFHASYRFESWWPAYRYTYDKLIAQARARLLIRQGKYEEAEAAMRKAIEAGIADIGTVSIKVANQQGPAFEYEHFVDLSRADLARILVLQGRLNDAELVAREALLSVVARFGGQSSQAAYVLVAMTQVLQEQGRFAEAVQLGTLAVRAFEAAGAVPDAEFLLLARQSLAAAHVARASYDAALLEYGKTFDAFAANPEVQSRIAGGSAGWALSLLKTGRQAESLAMLERIVPRYAARMGQGHVETAVLRGLKGMALVAGGQRVAAHAQFMQAAPVLVAALVSSSGETSVARDGIARIVLESTLALLAEMHGAAEGADNRAAYANEAFQIADALRSLSTQQAVSASAARAATVDAQLAQLMRREQDLRHEAHALHQVLRDLMAARREVQLPTVVADMGKRIQAIKVEQAALQAEVGKRFPAYANLLRPSAPSIEAARAVLRPGETLLSLFSTDQGTYVWAFRREGPVQFHVASLTRRGAAAAVDRLRLALDPGDVEPARLPAFDVEAAHQLFGALLAPVAPSWQGADDLLVVGNEALSRLPFALLPSARVVLKPAALSYQELKEVPWLIRQVAVTQLPSVNTLVSLRRVPPGRPGRAAFIGFGDPEFGAVAAGTRTARAIRDLDVPRRTEAAVAQGASPAWIRYSRIPPLPDTRDEILSLARALKADEASDVYLGPRASKASVLRANLDKYRVVAFATHGLLAGDFPGVDEPSLALANPNNGQHGLLTLEEIMRLKLDADLVILSACNTAAGDGAGSDAVSGLGRGFFYAGTRALLATHWPVESYSAKLLVTGIFDRQAATPGLSGTQALRQSMLALMDQVEKAAPGQPSFSYAHPMFWAPYAWIGEGGPQ